MSDHPPRPAMSAIADDAVSRSPKLSRGLVWCHECGRTQRVDSRRCLQFGWPTHCGYTMSLDSPKERAHA